MEELLLSKLYLEDYPHSSCPYLDLRLESLIHWKKYIDNSFRDVLLAKIVYIGWHGKRLRLQNRLEDWVLDPLDL